jgi:hypothetical protein
MYTCKWAKGGREGNVEHGAVGCGCGEGGGG